MKSLIVFALLLAFASALDLQGNVESLQRIFRGNTAADNQFPYQVGLSMNLGENTMWCGGSLIHNQWVLTAAHCTFQAKSAKVYIGGNLRLKSTVTYDVTPRDCITHENFIPETVKNDIALIKIPAVKYSKAIQPIRLPKIANSYPTFKDVVAIASGWGYTDDTTPTLPDQLQYADLTVISNTVCEKEYGEAIYDGKLCVASKKSISICLGDSGGPLALPKPRVLIGIASFGPLDGCELGGSQAFTRITYYLNWIKKRTGLNF